MEVLLHCTHWTLFIFLLISGGPSLPYIYPLNLIHSPGIEFSISYRVYNYYVWELFKGFLFCAYYIAHEYRSDIGRFNPATLWVRTDLNVGFHLLELIGKVLTSNLEPCARACYWPSHTDRLHQGCLNIFIPGPYKKIKISRKIIVHKIHFYNIQQRSLTGNPRENCSGLQKNFKTICNLILFTFRRL